MTATQLTLFEQSAGISNSHLLLLTASVFAVCYLTWGAWTALGQYQLWQAREISAYDLAVSLIRVVVMMIFLGYFVR